jgi:hypothetical protein
MLAVLHSAGLNLVVTASAALYQLACIVVVPKFRHEGEIITQPVAAARKPALNALERRAARA